MSAEVELKSGTQKQYILRNQGNTLPQKIHALAILVVPVFMLFVALGHSLTYGIEGWAVALMFAFWVLTIFGITAGFHRLFAHRAYKAGSTLRAVMAILGSMAIQGPPLYWVSNHRRHHRFSDQSGDPHSPHHSGDESLTGWKGFWHSHVGWSFYHEISNPAFFCKDLLRDKGFMWANKHYFKWVALSLLLPAFIGLLITGTTAGLITGFIWGSGVRLFFTYHSTCGINSVTHLFGHRSFELPDKSRNNLWLVLPTLGEGWHNNHHAYPSSAIFGYRWWEIDPAGLVLKLFKRLGIIDDLRCPGQDQIEKRKNKTKIDVEDRNEGLGE